MDRKILEESGYRVPPYRLMRMSDTAAKIVKLITCDVTCGYTNREAHMILEIVDSILAKGEGECS